MRRARPTGSRRDGTADPGAPRPAEAEVDDLSERALGTRNEIVAAARRAFEHMGFGGTRMEDIAREAGTSRANVYRYFPTKRDLLIEIGRNSTTAFRDVIARARAIPDAWSGADVERFVDAYLSYLDEHGLVLSTWIHATWDDHELRDLGLDTQMRSLQVVGDELARLRRRTDVPPLHEGMAVLGMIERLWYYGRIGHPRIQRADLRLSLVREVEGMLTRGAPSGAGGQTPTGSS